MLSFIERILILFALYSSLKSFYPIFKEIKEKGDLLNPILDSYLLLSLAFLILSVNFIIDIISFLFGSKEKDN